MTSGAVAGLQCAWCRRRTPASASLGGTPCQWNDFLSVSTIRARVSTSVNEAARCVRRPVRITRESRLQWARVGLSFNFRRQSRKPSCQYRHEPGVQTMTLPRRLLLAFSAAIALVALAPRAFALDAPAGKVVLTITGKVGTPNAGAKADFDMAMIEKLPQHSFTMTTP